MLKKIQLFVAGGEEKIASGGTLAALLGAERRIGENQIIVFHALAGGREGIAKLDLSLNVV